MIDECISSLQKQRGCIEDQLPFVTYPSPINHTHQIKSREPHETMEYMERVVQPMSRAVPLQSKPLLDARYPSDKCP